MRKKFKARKKINLLKLFFCIFFVLLLFLLFKSFILTTKLASSNEEFLNKLLNDSNHYILYKNVNENPIYSFVKLITKIDIKEPKSILEKSLKYKTNNMNISYTASDDVYSLNSDYIEDTNKDNNIENPIVYIYNTHQLEEYNKTNLEEYNIKPNVLMASYILREYLNRNNIKTVVETADITDFLNVNGWNYSKSYNASRFYLDEAIKKYPNLKLIIDLHRDAIEYNVSTVTINDKKYAKVLFIVGLDYENYQPNLDLANSLNNLINSKYPGLSRGVLKKSGKNVNGIYNQDLKNNIVLIECGGYQNNIDEVMNTMIALSDIIKIYLGV